MAYLIQPIVNLNGTTREELVNQQLDVIRAANALIEAMSAAMPHGRDYQTLADGGATYRAARDAYHDRLRQVVLLRDEIEGYATSLQAGHRFSVSGLEG